MTQLVFSNNMRSAYVGQVVRAFQKHHPNHYLGRTALQKLVYFSKVLGVPIPFSFQIYNYGPYSDQLTSTVDMLLADEVLLDTSNNPARYSCYKVSDRYSDLDPELTKTAKKYLPKIESVVKALGKFKPEELEVIATLHFVSATKKEQGDKQPSKVEVISEFQKIKRNKFPKSEVNSWYEALKEAQLV